MNTSTGRGSPVNEASRINMSTHLRGCRHLLLDDVRSLGGVRLRRRHQLPKLGQVLRPSREHSLTLGRTRLRDVLLDESLELRLALSHGGVGQGVVIDSVRRMGGVLPGQKEIVERVLTLEGAAS